MLPNDKVLKHMVTHPETGLLSGGDTSVKKGLVHIGYSTVHPDTSRDMAKLHTAQGGAAEDRLQIVYDTVMKRLQASDSGLYPSQQLLFKLIREQQGEPLGLKKPIVGQMIESALQIKYNMASPQEFLMCDERACDWLYQQAEEKAKTFVDEIQEFCEYRVSKTPDSIRTIFRPTY
jgi:hypothetical protein